MELEFPRLEFHLFFFFLVHVRLHPRELSLNGLELEFVKLKFQKQSNILKRFICMLCTKIFSKKLLFGKFCPKDGIYFYWHGNHKASPCYTVFYCLSNKNIYFPIVHFLSLFVGKKKRFI